MKRSNSKKAMVLKLLAKHHSPKDIAKQVGCGVAYVYSVRHADKIKSKFIFDPKQKPKSFVEPKSLSIVEKHWIPDAKVPDGSVQISMVEHDMLINNWTKGQAYDSIRARNEELEAQYALCEEQLHAEQCRVFDLKAIVKYLEGKLNANTKG